MKLYHGNTDKTLTLHVGLCLTDDEDSAANYSYRSGVVHTVVLDFRDLTVVEVEDGFDYDAVVAVGDDGATINGADVLEYEDCDTFGRTHATWRLMTPAALAALTVVGATPADEI